MNARQPYPSDLTSDQWEVVKDLIPAPRPGGRPAKYERREIVNALLYVIRTGCQWRALPHDLPPWRIVYWYFMACGWAGLCDHIGATLVKSPNLAGHEALGELTGYFAAHTNRLNYCHRLYTGHSIGSGMVEGAAKNLVGRRLKQTGARWEVNNVNKMAELCCLTYSDHWSLYWASPN